VTALEEEEGFIGELVWWDGTDSYLPHSFSRVTLIGDQVHKETSGLAMVAKCQERRSKQRNKLTAGAIKWVLL